MDRTSLPYWEARSLRWRVVPPLAPGAEDIAFYERTVAALQPARALLLGVTAPIASMHWPPSTQLTAVDWAAGMFRHVWPRATVPRDAQCVRADWRELPFADASLDLVIGDGCYSVLRDCAGIGELNAEVARVLRPGGVFCIRCFRRPDEVRRLDDLFADLLDGRITNLDLFRWMLAMAVQGDARDGVSLNAVWRVWHAHVPDAESAGRTLGWSADAIANMEAWQHLESRYYFPSLPELIGIGKQAFVAVDHDLPGYTWGAQFPRLLLRR